MLRSQHRSQQRTQHGLSKQNYNFIRSLWRPVLYVSKDLLVAIYAVWVCLILRIINNFFVSLDKQTDVNENVYFSRYDYLVESIRSVESVESVGSVGSVELLGLSLESSLSSSIKLAHFFQNRAKENLEKLDHQMELLHQELFKLCSISGSTKLSESNFSSVTPSIISRTFGVVVTTIRARVDGSGPTNRCPSNVNKNKPLKLDPNRSKLKSDTTSQAKGLNGRLNNKSLEFPGSNGLARGLNIFCPSNDFSDINSDSISCLDSCSSQKSLFPSYQHQLPELPNPAYNNNIKPSTLTLNHLHNNSSTEASLPSTISSDSCCNSDPVYTESNSAKTQTHSQTFTSNSYTSSSSSFVSISPKSKSCAHYSYFSYDHTMTKLSYSKSSRIKQQYRPADSPPSSRTSVASSDDSATDISSPDTTLMPSEEFQSSPLDDKYNKRKSWTFGLSNPPNISRMSTPRPEDRLGHDFKTTEYGSPISDLDRSPSIPPLRPVSFHQRRSSSISQKYPTSPQTNPSSESAVEIQVEPSFEESNRSKAGKNRNRWSSILPNDVIQQRPFHVLTPQEKLLQDKLQMLARSENARLFGPESASTLMPSPDIEQPKSVGKVGADYLARRNISLQTYSNNDNKISDLDPTLTNTPQSDKGRRNSRRDSIRDSPMEAVSQIFNTAVFTFRSNLSLSTPDRQPLQDDRKSSKQSAKKKVRSSNGSYEISISRREIEALDAALAGPKRPGDISGTVLSWKMTGDIMRTALSACKSRLTVMEMCQFLWTTFTHPENGVMDIEISETNWVPPSEVIQSLKEAIPRLTIQNSQQALKLLQRFSARLACSSFAISVILVQVILLSVMILAYMIGDVLVTPIKLVSSQFVQEEPENVRKLARKAYIRKAKRRAR